MSISNTGLLIHFDEIQRANLIQRGIEHNGYETFSDTLSIHDWKIGQITIALLCFSDSTIGYIALAKRGYHVATSKYKVEFSNILNLNELPIATIENSINERLQRYFIRASQGIGGSIPPGTWKAIIRAIKSNRPSLIEDIEKLFSSKDFSRYTFYGKTAEIFLQEREALGVSLDIFSGTNKLRNNVLSKWVPNKDSITEMNEESSRGIITPTPNQISFLDGIPHYIREESAIQHDLYNWSGIRASHIAGTSTFIEGDRQLDIIYTNRNDLEHTLGVDLIYYNEFYELFVLIQYKMMHEENDMVLYRPDSQLQNELSRMDDFYTTQQINRTIQSHEEYRLNDDGFMFKLVPNKGLQPISGELIKGMYITREYMHFLLGPQGPQGPRGGKQITFENAPRYFNNSQFIDNVRSGWIGTRGVTSQQLKRMIKEYYMTGRALMIAHESERKS